MSVVRTAAWLSVILVLGTGCDQMPRITVDGLWERGGISGDHFGNYYLRLRNDGNEIAGFACRTSDVHVVFSDVPVHGDYPSLDFVVTAGTVEPCCQQFIGSQFSGEVTDEQTIVADFRIPGGVPERMTLHRSAGPPLPGCFSQ